ncbi:MAG: sodium:calcium antiporter [Acidimicrobiales bacterium]|jgi:cation:H+ antiporter|nr:sodium:calcium antiporter [Acidimicrobiales bacterium]MDP6298534.1 sodium:calcium antiporter [Acidimicrobiales bacterium]HJM27604.1 sodium:calcium antiporter [Acidimicrobiales bacterium]HJM97527.1 sodium:calcium antiporter [Acidimicrobiales bacterium]
MLIDIISLVVGISVLVYSTEMLVDTSGRVAKELGVSIVVIGAVVVGFGTSLPEMAVSTMAATRNDLNLGTGNVVGSIIANLSLVAAGAALTGRIPIPQRILKTHLPISMNAVFWFCFFVQDDFQRYEGFILLGLLFASLGLMIRIDNRASIISAGETEIPLSKDQDSFQVGTQESLKFKSEEMTKIGISLIGVLGSSYFITEGAMGLAVEWGVGTGFIGASLVAVGTSLPELVASIIAVRKGKPEIVIGAILGSNVFNGTAIGASMGIFGPGSVTETALTGWLTIGALSGITFLWIWKGLSGKPVGRVTAFLLLAIYGIWMFFVGT